MSAEEQKTPELEELERELELNPFNVRALNQIAKLHADRCDYQEACQYYEKIVRLDEDNGKAWTSLGHCYLLRGEYQKCFSAYQRAIYAMPESKDPQLWYGIGLLYNRFDSYENAEPAYQAVLRLDPDFEQKYEVMYKLGCIYKKRNSLEHAVTYLKNSLLCEKIPLTRKIDVLCQLASCYEKQGDKPKAIETCKEAIELKPDNFKALEFLGWMLASTNDQEDAAKAAKDFEEALKYLKQALELVGDNTGESGDLYYLIGRVHLQQKNFGEGQDAFQNAIYKNTNAYMYWVSIGILYAEASQPQDAFDCFVKASNIAGDASEVWYNMGILYERCNQKPEAILAYTRACTIDSSNTLAATRKQQVNEPGPLPDFVHPSFEISEMPFSIKKAERPLKAMKMTPPPTLNKIKSDEANDSSEPLERKLEPISQSSLNAPIISGSTTSSIPQASSIPQIPQASSPIIPQHAPSAPSPAPAPPKVSPPTAMAPFSVSGMAPEYLSQMPMSQAGLNPGMYPGMMMGSGMPMQPQMQTTVQAPPQPPQSSQAQMQSGMVSIPQQMQAGMQSGMQPGMQSGMQPGMQAGMQPGMQQMSPGMQQMQASMQPGMQAGMQGGMPQGMMPMMGMPGMGGMPGMPGMSPMFSGMPHGMAGMAGMPGMPGMGGMPMGGMPGMGGMPMSPGDMSKGQGVPKQGMMNPQGYMGMNPMMMQPWMMQQMMQMMGRMYMGGMNPMMMPMGQTRMAPQDTRPQPNEAEAAETLASMNQDRKKRQGDMLKDPKGKRR
mmetsp:Transcript_27369/g.49266  ORF Transcript_27369/g.49266 Transcript_27369/m.49266 type:complete len:775 (-) Transcript_27369:138-2462(-)